MNYKYVLIVTSTDDNQHVNQVRSYLSQYGYHSWRIDVDRFGIDWGLTLLYNSDQSLQVIIHTTENDISVSDESIQSIWLRKPRIANFKEYMSISSKAQIFMQDEWHATLGGLYRILKGRGVFWVSDPDNIIKASYKPFQLLVASQVGFRIPRTIITSRPEAAKSFWSDLAGNVIAKPVGRGWITDDSNPDDVFFVMTNEIQERDLQNLDNLTLSPVTFQENISKDYEIRVTVVGRQVFSVAIESQKSEVSKIDWRRYDLANTPYYEVAIPDCIRTKCLEVVRRLGLEYGAIDLIKTPQDEYIFLEINPVGQFLWLERLTGVPISDAIARLLAGIEPPLNHH